MPDAMTLISTITVSGSTTNVIDFSSIPQTYTHLMLVCSIKNTADAETYMTINGTGGNGTATTTTAGYGRGTGTPTSTRVANTSALFQLGYAGPSYAAFGSLKAHFPYYAINATKTMTLESVSESVTATGESRIVNGGISTSIVISSIQVISSTGYWVPNSTASLYGILQA